MHTRAQLGGGTRARRGTPPARAVLILGSPLLGVLGAPIPASLGHPFAVTSLLLAQDTIQNRIEESKNRLDQIRAERARLRREMEGLAGQVHDETQAIGNLERQIGVSSSVVAEIDLQLSGVVAQADQITYDMIRTRDELALRRAVLGER